MNNKRLSAILILFSFVFFAFLLYFNSTLGETFSELGCSMNKECLKIDRSLNFIHAGFGFFGFMLGLGFYILFFNKTEESILKRLEEEKDKKIKEEKFDLILKALDPYEKKVLRAIRNQEGITQNTLRLRTDMSKSKLSYVLKELEKRNIIKRLRKGKTFAVFLKI